MNSLLVQAFGLVGLLILGYLFGRVAERRHYRRIVKAEEKTQHLPVVASRYPPEKEVYDQILVHGSVVIASDYFKTFLASLINIFGGRVTPFESLLDRARRESVLRMKDQAQSLGARYIFNVKFESSRIAVGRIGAMEVLVYGTALIPLSQAGDSEGARHGL